MLIYSIVMGLTVLLTVGLQAPPPMGTSVVVFGDTEVSTLLTANKVVPASFFTNCVRTPLNVVLSSQSAIDWMMTTGVATPTCGDSIATWNMTSIQRQSWNVTASSVKTSFVNSFTTFRSYAIQRPTAVCVVSGLTPSSPVSYTSVSAAADPSNPERFLITLSQQPGGAPNGQE